jgi:transposase
MSRLSTPIAETILLVNTQSFAGISRIQPYAAGMDIGAHEIWVCVPGEGDTQIIRPFGTYTADLHAIGEWLLEHQIRTIAMESTGVYWILIFEYLESLSFQCCLISSRSIKRVPGRKSDVEDCQWIQTLHSYGLLENSFRPEADLVALRTLLRNRAQLIQHRAPHIQHMQKALLKMNIQLSQALNDVTGQTGQHIIRAIVAGERDPFQLAKLRNYRCQKDEAEIAKALTGTWQDEHLFVLQQALELYDFYTAQIQACDAEIERTYALIRPDWTYAGPDEFPKKKNRSRSVNAPQNEDRLRRNLIRITGVDLAAVDGMSVSIAQTIIFEIGTDMSKWPTVKHFCSWLGLAPKNEITGGKVIRSRTGKTKNRAGQAFRLAASSVTRADCAFGAFYRRKKSQIGPAQAMVATAHMIARTVYFMLKNQVHYIHISAKSFDKRYREQQIHYLHRKAAKLGFRLTPVGASPRAVS